MQQFLFLLHFFTLVSFPIETHFDFDFDYYLFILFIISDNSEDLLRLIIECINRAGSAQFGSLFNTVATTIQENNLGKHEGSKLKKDINEILWDLIIERFATFGSVDGNAEARHPFIILTN